MGRSRAYSPASVEYSWHLFSYTGSPPAYWHRLPRAVTTATLRQWICHAKCSNRLKAAQKKRNHSITAAAGPRFFFSPSQQDTQLTLRRQPGSTEVSASMVSKQQHQLYVPRPSTGQDTWLAPLACAVVRTITVCTCRTSHTYIHTYIHHIGQPHTRSIVTD